MSTTTTEYSSSRKSRPSMGAAQVNISVGTKNRGGPMVSSVRRSNVVSRSSHGGIVRPAGDVQRMSTATLQAVTGNRQAEKTEMAGLNTKLAGFIERNKFQTATIEALQEELARLKKSKGFNQDRVRDMFKDEMDEARNALADIKKELARLQAENLKIEDKVQDQAEELQCRTQQRDDYQNEVSKLTAMIGDLEGELNAARRSLDNVEMEKKTLKQDLDMCRADNDKLRDETAMAREKQIVLQNELDALYEQHEFDVASLEDEISELRRIIEELRCVTPKIQDKWKSDFKECIRVIQEDYNNRLGLMELECKRRYDDQLNKLQDNLNRDTTDGTLLKSENKKLKNQIGPLDHQIRDLKDENERLKDEMARLKQLYDDECEECAGEKDKLRAEIAGLGDELDCVQDNLAALQNDNMNLSLEIACYKKLLEGEEAAMAKTMEQRNNMQSQGGAALANMISSGGGSGGQSSSSS